MVHAIPHSKVIKENGKFYDVKTKSVIFNSCTYILSLLMNKAFFKQQKKKKKKKKYSTHLNPSDPENFHDGTTPCQMHSMHCFCNKLTIVLLDAVVHDDKVLSCTGDAIMMLEETQ